MKTIVEKLFENAERTPDRYAVILETERITYRDLCQAVSGYARYLKDRGIRKGDRIVVQATHSVSFTTAVFACHAVGAVFVPADKTAPQEKLLEIVEQVRAAFAIVQDPQLTASSCPSVCVDAVISEAGQHGTQPITPECTPDDMADIMFTTGTTGKSKGVVLTHRNLIATVEARMNRLSVRPDNVGMTAVPINHVAPMRELYLNIWNGSSVCFIDGVMKLNAFFTFLKQEKVTSLYMPPAHVHLVMDMASAEFTKYTDQLDYVYIGSAPFDEPGKEQLCSVLPHTRLFFSYGSSENGSVSLLEFSRDRGRASCCGIPCDGVRLTIVDDEGEQVGVGEDGLLTVSSSMNMYGYWNMPELTAEVMKDNVFYTNDIGHFDEDGFLYVIGRKDDIINIGGLKVSPSEIEDAARATEEISDCICIAVSDPFVGQKPKLLVVTKPQMAFAPEKIKAVLRQKLEAFKVPDEIVEVDHIERTANGKPNRKAYRG